MAIELVAVNTGRCLGCGESGQVFMPKEAYDIWQEGAHIQTAWPEGSANEREQLISGTHGKCYDKMFEGMDED